MHGLREQLIRKQSTGGVFMGAVIRKQIKYEHFTGAVIRKQSVTNKEKSTDRTTPFLPILRLTTGPMEIHVSGADS
jgi:hypothetical protein